MSIFEESSGTRDWRCPHCREALISDSSSLTCAGCGRQFPVIAGVSLLVREPIAYLRSELAFLDRAVRDAKQRRDALDKSGREMGLTKASLDRHRDVIDAEVARAATFLALLEPAAKALETMADNSADSRRVGRPGWIFDSLLPYLLRDWTATAELQAANSLISAALEEAFPNPSEILVAFAGCGAGGLLAEISPSFKHVVGFDLTLPVLIAARHLLDGENVDLALPRAINELGRITLHNRNSPTVGVYRELVAMDAFDTAFADGSVNCVVTSFLIDLIPDPRRLADEIHRILSPNGIWINYGPSGPLRAHWRFDQSEGAAFFEASGFAVVRADAHRATYLDLSRDCPNWSFQNHICYLTSMRKAGQDREAKVAPSIPAELSRIIPEHYPRATLIKRESLEAVHKHTVHLRHERSPGFVETLEIGSDAARIIGHVDGTKTVLEIANMLNLTSDLPVEETIQAFDRYFNMGLLCWRDPSAEPAL